MLPKLNVLDSIKYTNSADINPMTLSLVSLKNKFLSQPAFLTGSLFNPNKQTNIFSAQKINSLDNSSRWILGQIDNNTNRIINAYKKENSNLISYSESNSPELQINTTAQQQQTPENVNRVGRRRRRIIKASDSVDFNNQQIIIQKDNNRPAEVQNFESNQSPNNIQRSSNKKRKLIKSNSQSIAIDQAASQQNENSNLVKQLPPTPKPFSISDLQDINKNQRDVEQWQADASKDQVEQQYQNKQVLQVKSSNEKPQAIFSFMKSPSHQRTQSSIQFIGSQESEKGYSPKSDNQSIFSNEQSLDKQRQLSLPLSKSILKNSHQKQLLSPQQSGRHIKKQVCFNCINQIF